LQGFGAHIKNRTSELRDHVTYWLKRFKGPVHVLNYERLRDNIRWEMFRLARFLRLPVDVRRLWCVAENSEGEYHRARPSWMTHEAMFSGELPDIVRKAVVDVTPILREHGIGNNVLDYYFTYNSLK